MLKKPFLIITVTICALLSGCQTNEPTVVANGKISNPSMGFNGYEAKLPPGYIEYNHEKMGDNHKMGSVVHTIQENNTIRGAHYGDQVIVVSPDFAILFSVSEVYLPTKYRRLNDIGNVSTSSVKFAHLQDRDKQLFLSNWVNGAKSSGNIVEREVIDLSDTPAKNLYVGRVVMEYPSIHLVIVDYYVLGKSTEMFVISGAGSLYKLDEISSDIEYMAKNLDVK
ncbi:hypothetical protein [Rubellicoccus peritrichatus]|uniref:Lipoprotein n=1 Tax=Rubellicoccus peritrichatus TaxID=3080537 RepID=A0AAQ3LBM9_9BACT|nr:hypothetical protein [Puniceicoccus sp. CR14]WOO41559.1 hypothetical protein RZN69_00560 [Puniceicoccus sp. CR14]